MTTPVPVQKKIITEPARPVVSAQDHVELGSRLRDAGFDTDEVRALVAIVEQTSRQVATSMIPAMAEIVRRAHDKACDEIKNKILNEPNRLGYLPQDRVLRMVREVKIEGPRH